MVRSIRLTLASTATLAVLACPLAGAAAANAAVWSAPQTISHTHASVFPLSAGTTATGTGVVSWLWQDDFLGLAPRGASFASRPAASATYGTEHALPADVRGVQSYGTGRLVVATVSSEPRSTDSILSVRLGNLAGHFGARQAIRRHVGVLRGVTLAANARGDSALLWQENLRRIYVSLRRPGERFGPARLLTTGGTDGLSVAVGPSGDVLVAWDARGRIRTRWMGRAARTFGPVDELRSLAASNVGMQTAITAGGGTWIAWTSQPMVGPVDAYIQVARRAPGAQRFDRALLLDSSSTLTTPTAVSLAAGPGGRAALAWGMLDIHALTTTVKAAKLGATGNARISELARFPAVRAGEASAGYGDDASATAAWVQPADSAWTTAQVYASRSQAGGSWGAPELVSAGPQPSRLAVTYPPRRGTPTVLFANHTGPESAAVQAATRQP